MTVSADKQADMNYAMRLSFGVGLVLLVIKTYAYGITGSPAILSDAAESVIHVFAVGFAAYSMWLSFKPADRNHPYGHDKITFFSAGFEGALIIFAALYILYESIYKIIFGISVSNVDEGIAYLLAAALINLILGLYLWRKGQDHRSLILEANGKHILTDCGTTVAVIAALLLVKATGIVLFDPAVAILAALNILWTGGILVKESVGGLMDKADQGLQENIRRILDSETKKHNLQYHHLRHRPVGNRLFIDFHLLFPEETTLLQAHEIASEIEYLLTSQLNGTVEVTSHLEPLEQHNLIHDRFGLQDKV